MLEIQVLRIENKILLEIWRSFKQVVLVKLSKSGNKCSVHGLGVSLGFLGGYRSSFVSFLFNFVHGCMEKNPLSGKLFEHGKNCISFIAILK